MNIQIQKHRSDGTDDKDGFLSPKVILSQLLTKMDDLKERICDKVQNTEVPVDLVNDSIQVVSSPRESNGSRAGIRNFVEWGISGCD